MIVFDKLWAKMKEKGITTYKLPKACGIDSKTVRRRGQTKIWKPKP